MCVHKQKHIVNSSYRIFQYEDIPKKFKTLQWTFTFVVKYLSLLSTTFRVLGTKSLTAMRFKQTSWSCLRNGTLAMLCQVVHDYFVLFLANHLLLITDSFNYFNTLIYFVVVVVSLYVALFGVVCGLSSLLKLPNNRITSRVPIDNETNI